jgi:hypothetical protein
MGHPIHRRRVTRPKSASFAFTTRKLSGLPQKDDAATRAEKERLVREFLEKKKNVGR